VLCERKTQLIAAIHASLGPRQDSPLLRNVLRKAEKLIHFHRILADAGYDSERNHVFCREQLKIRECVIPIRRNLRKRSVKRCSGKYRQKMRWRFPKRIYGQRWQIESLFSRFKRRLGDQVLAHSGPGQVQETYLRAITMNFLIYLQQTQPA
jgi:hypothetical protein